MGIFDLVLAGAFMPAGILLLARDWGAGLFVLCCALVLGIAGILEILTSRNNNRAWIWDDRIEWERGFGGRWQALKPLPLSSVERVAVSERAGSILLWVKSEWWRAPFRGLTPGEGELMETVARLRRLLPDVEWSYVNPR